MLPEIPEPNQFSRNGGRTDHGLQQPPQKKLYHKPNILNFKDQNKLPLPSLNLRSALPSIKWFAPAWNGPRVKAASLPTCCPGLQSVVWSLALQINRQKKKKEKRFLTLPSAPSSTPSSPSTISVETETPPEGCRCFCPSIFRSLNADKKMHYWKMQHKSSFLCGKHEVHPLATATTTRPEFYESSAIPQSHLQESINF